MRDKLDSTLVGVAGEYLVAGELSRRGYIASITLRNSRGIDIIASNSDGSKSVSIQVKTNSDGGKSWILSKKSEKFYSDSHYYIFVALGKINERPIFHIVPSKKVAEHTLRGHANWLKGKKAEDIDIICPCNYRDADLNEYGACFCALYVSRKIIDGKVDIQPVPERRPTKEESETNKKNLTKHIGRKLSKPVWRCKVCGYLCGRDEPPEVCPICKAKKERFEEFM